MEFVQLLLSILHIPVLVLAFVSLYYYSRVMRLITVRRGSILVTSGIFLLIGYVLFILPWVVISDRVEAIVSMAYALILVALIVLLYGVGRIYRDWREVIP
jgi:apolipoprotein N-acyltransferase